MGITIICPIYNGEKYIKKLYKRISNQKNVNIVEIKFILTESKDKSEEILNELKLIYSKISRNDFSHSLVREKAAFEAKGDIIVFITQDINIFDENWLYELVKGIEAEECEAAFSRQIAYEDHQIEKYTRETNYPAISRIVSKNDIEKLGLMTFFFSDASSAVSKKVFLELNGYDGKDLPTNEDMYFAYKLIMSGYRIKYAANSKVIHSHNLNFKETFKRYRDIGMFFKENAYFSKYSANERGSQVAIYILKRALEEKKYSLILNLISNFSARLLGMKLGKMVGGKNND